MRRIRKGLAALALAALALWWAVPAAAGSWAEIGLVRHGVYAGQYEVQVQVLQHGHNPHADARVTVTARLGDQTLEAPASLVFMPVGERSTPAQFTRYNYAEGGWPEDVQPVYVARLPVPTAGVWEVQVKAEHWLYIDHPLRLTADVTAEALAAAPKPPAGYEWPESNQTEAAAGACPTTETDAAAPAAPGSAAPAAPGSAAPAPSAAAAPAAGWPIIAGLGALAGAVLAAAGMRLLRRQQPA